MPVGKRDTTRLIVKRSGQIQPVIGIGSRAHWNEPPIIDAVGMLFQHRERRRGPADLGVAKKTVVGRAPGKGNGTDKAIHRISPQAQGLSRSRTKICRAAINPHVLGRVGKKRTLDQQRHVGVIAIGPGPVLKSPDPASRR